MDLQGDDAVFAGDRVFVGQLAHQLAVDLLGDVVPLRDNVVLVPFVRLDDFGQVGGIAELLHHCRTMVLADHDLLAALGQDVAIVLAVARCP